MSRLESFALRFEIAFAIPIATIMRTIYLLVELGCTRKANGNRSIPAETTPQYYSYTSYTIKSVFNDRYT